MLKILILALTTIVMTPKTETEPSLKSKGGGEYLARNPLKNNVEIEIDCGVDYERQTKLLYPNTRESFMLVTPTGRPLADCWMTGWTNK